MKKLFISLIFIFLILFSITASAYNIDILKAEGIVVGDEGGFRENDNVSRSEFIKMINRTFSIPQELTSVHIPDVSSDKWYYNDILTAVNYGYVKGDEHGNMNPEHFITRQEAFTIAARLTGYIDTPVSAFTDDGYIASWAKGPATSLKEMGFISDTLYLKPDKLMTRADCFSLFYNILTKRFDSGNGSKEAPYVIRYPYQLSNIRFYPEKFFSIEKDLDFKLYNLSYIPVKNFKGTLLGNGHKIIGLYSSQSATNSLFNTTDENAVISGITLVCPEHLFSITNENNGTISDCLNTSYFKTKELYKFSSYKGAIADINNGIVKNCGNSSYISLRDGDIAAGGICGLNNGTIENCFNLANGLSTKCYAIAGKNDGTVKNCYSTSSVEITDKNAENCYYTGSKVLTQGTFITKEKLPSVFSSFVISNGVAIPAALHYSGNENFSEFSGGDGTVENPYIITNSENFKNINSYPDSHFVQNGNIILTTPVTIEDFKGYYNGNGYTLSHLSIAETEGSCALFETNRGTLENIKIYDGFFFSYQNSASLCQTNQGSIINCSSYSYVVGNSCGGLVYTNNGTITNSFFEGKISASSSGGLAYNNNGHISNSYANANIFGKQGSSLVYNNKGILTTSIASGTLNATETAGVVFNNIGEINRCVYNSTKNSTLINTGTADALYKDNLNVISFFDTDIWTSGKTSLTLKSNPSFIQNTNENTYSFAGGDGTSSNPYIIITPLHLNNIRYYPYASFILSNDLDMSITNFKAIDEFNGNFNGNSKKISGLKSPLFTTNNGIIQNLELKKSHSFTATNNGTIISCKSSSEITGETSFAFANENNGSIIQCLNNGKLYGNKVASIALVNKGTITDCINAAPLVGTGKNSTIFGIAGGGGILRGYNTGDMYFESSFGNVHPVSDGSYSETYYLNRYQSHKPGGLTYEGFNKSLFKDQIYTSAKMGYPIFESVDFSDVIFPLGYSTGDGSEDSPYTINSMKDLFDIRMYPSAHFILTRDIDLSAEYTSPSIYNNAGLGFTPINSFDGVLDGNYATIYSLNILYSGKGDSAFIIWNNGNIKNLTIAESRIEGFSKASALTISNKGKIENIALRGSRVGAKNGISAAFACTNEERGQILKCHNLSDIFASDLAGGICVYNYNYIADCTNNGGIIANSIESSAISAGICASNHSSITKCVNNGKIFSYSDKKTAIAGGITGSEHQETSHCYNTGALTVKAPDKSYSGGISGYCSDANISNCYNLGYITATSNLQYIGSIVGGGLSGKISTCYYDHTLSSAAGEQCIRTNGVFSVAPEELTSLSVISGLNEKIWETKNTPYPFPQIKTNPHKTLPDIENIRDFAGGNGTLENPYKIITKDHLSNVRKHLGSAFVLLSDIDMANEDFLPIGDEIFSFFGTFLGNGHTISNLSTTSGMFRENHGEIYNLKLENISLSADTSGAIASVNTGLIYKCSNTSSTAISAQTAVSGGIAGINNHSGMIVSSYTNGFFGGNAHSAVSGGISGYNYGLIAGSYNGMNVNYSVVSSALLGGICGYNSGTISDCINYSDLGVFNSLSAESNVGGIASGSNGSIVNCISSAQTLTGKKTGAICSTLLNKNIYNCYYLNTVNEPFALETVTGGDNYQLGSPDFYSGLDTATMWYLQEGYFPILIETMF